MGNQINKQRIESRRRTLEDIIQHSHCSKPLDFTMQSSKHGRTIKFADNVVKSYGLWGICLLCTELNISSATCVEYEFSISIHNNSLCTKGSRISLGFIDESLLSRKKNDQAKSRRIDFDNNLINIDQDKQFSVQLGEDAQHGLIKLYGQNKSVSDSIRLNTAFEDQDIIKLRVNFQRRDIELYCNDKYVSTLFRDIPSNVQLVPCVAIKNAQLKVLTSDVKMKQ